ncbi:MAG TPA: C40 family peptidase [Acidimicrobiales bacterium]|nr:C40 family peptidase [Acidimicrobiales bacterium]
MEARVTVPVATVWAAPDAPRPVDRRALGACPDPAGWVSGLSEEDRRGLLGRVVTQALWGEAVVIDEERQGWCRVVVGDQPSSLDSRGYPGWVPLDQLGPAGTSHGPAVVVAARVAPAFSDPSDARPCAGLSFGTELVAPDGLQGTVDGRLAVATRTGLGLWVHPGGVAAAPDGAHGGADLAASARVFLGLPYLWGGTSGLGVDCSGLVALVHRRHGLVIPRDAHDQAAAGRPVPLEEVRAGDLVFFAPPGGTVDHVGMALGAGRLLQAPSTGRGVEVADLGEPRLARRVWGVRRFAGPAPPP